MKTSSIWRGSLFRVFDIAEFDCIHTSQWTLFTLSHEIEADIAYVHSTPALGRQDESSSQIVVQKEILE